MTRLDEIQEQVKTLGVVGLGTMGAGIVQTALQAGYTVLAHDANELALRRGREKVEGGLRKMAEKGKLTKEQLESALARVQIVKGLDGLGACDLVVEAVIEQESIKKDVLRELDAIMGPTAILATNTSSISVTRLAAVTKRSDRFIGMHFMNPVPLMKLVEIIRGLETSDETYDRVRHAALAMDKTPVEVNDSPGFVSNRILAPMINEAVYCLYEGVGTAEAIDEVMKLGMNHPMGPLALADLIGLDVCLDILRVLHSGLGDDKYRPCPLLVKMVDAGRLGRKSGRGFYTYA